MSVELEKINFKNFQEPAVDAENLNKMQKNIEDAINVIDSLLGGTDWKVADINGDYVSSGEVKYMQIGKLVIVNIVDLAIGTTTEQISVLATGLPSGGGTGMLNQFDMPNSKRVVVSNGNLQTWYDSINASPNQLYGTLFYFTN